MEECMITIPNPFAEDSLIDLYLTLNQKTDNSVKIINGSPFISSKVRLSGKVLSADQNSNFFNEENLKIIQNYANEYLKTQLDNYLYKVSKEFGSDIDLFGKHAVKHFSTWDKWVDYNWVSNFKNSFFDVDVNINVTSSYLIS